MREEWERRLCHHPGIRKLMSSSRMSFLNLRTQRFLSWRRIWRR